MNTSPKVRIDERGIAVAHESYKWSFIFLTFALMIDITVRGAVRGEAPWDLYALVGISALISRIYQLRRGVDVLAPGAHKRMLLLMLVIFLIGLIMAFTQVWMARH